MARARRDDGPLLTFAMLADDLPRLQPLIDDYIRRTGVTIVADPQPLAQLYTKVNISIIQGTKAYEIVSILDTWFPEFAEGGWLSNLERAFEDQDRADLIPAQLALGTRAGGEEVEALPWSANVQLFIRRGSLFDRLGISDPQDWVELAEVARLLAEHRDATGSYAYGMRGAGTLDASLAHVPLLRGLGRDVLAQETWESELATPEAMQSIQTLTELARFAPPGLASTGASELADQMATGQIAMTAELWADQLFPLVEPTSSTVADDLVIASQPARRGITNAGVSATWLLALPKTGDAHNEALEFVRWLTAPAQQRRLLLDSLVIPTRASVFRDADVSDRWPHLGRVRDALARSSPRPRTPLYPAVEEIHGRYVHSAMLGEREGADAMRHAHLDVRALMVREGVIDR